MPATFQITSWTVRTLPDLSECRHAYQPRCGYRSLRVAAAKQRAQGQKRPAKGKPQQRSQGDKGQGSVQSRQDDTTRLTSAEKGPQFVNAESVSSEANGTSNFDFEKRLKELRSRGEAYRAKNPQQLLEEEEALSDRIHSHQSASASSPGRNTEDTTDNKPSFWSRAAVGFGALALVGVFVVATVGVDLGLGGRRGSRQPVSQTAALSDEERKAITEQATKLEDQARTNPNASEALAGAAASYAALGDLGKSAGLLEQLTAAEPRNVSAWQALGDVRIRQGDARSSASAYERALAEAQEDSITLLQGLCRALGQDGRWQEAVDRLIKVRGNAAKSDAGAGVYEASMLLAKTYAAWPQHTADSLAVYDELIQQSPQDFRAFLAKGLVLKSLGRIADAQRNFLQARYLAPAEARGAVDDLAER